MEDVPLRFYWDVREAPAETLTVSLRREEIETALRQESADPVLLLSVELDGNESRQSSRQRIALDWSREDLERLAAEPGDVAVALDASDLRRALHEDVEAHGGRTALAITSIVATLAGASTAAAVRIPEPESGIRIVGYEAGSAQSERVRYRLVGVRTVPTKPKPGAFSERRNP